MTTEEKDLLLKDLCGRLPHGVKCQVQEDEFTYIGTLCRIEVDGKNGNLLDFAESISGLDCQVYLSEVKPYLFPLSSITLEQRCKVSYIIPEISIAEQKIIFYDNGGSVKLEQLDKLFNFFNLHHIDWRGLIPMGLANDATGLNIY